MSSPRSDRTSEDPHSHGFDSRAWTGPEPERPTLDRRRARAAFRAAGGSGAVRPQRMASSFLWIGLGSLLAFALLGPMDVDPWPVPTVWRNEVRELFGLGWSTAGPDATGRARVTVGPDILLLITTLLAGWAGILTAWTCRRALARGFRAEEADRVGAVFVTRRVDLLAPGIGFLFLTASEADTISLATLLVLALLSVTTVRAMTAVAERRFAGLGARSPVASRWDVAALVASSTVLAMVIVRAWAT